MSSTTFQMQLATVPVLEDIAREGARRMLQQAIEREVAEYVEAHKRCLDEAGRRLVVRNGSKGRIRGGEYGDAVRFGGENTGTQSDLGKIQGRSPI